MLDDVNVAGMCVVPVLLQLTELFGAPTVAASWRDHPEFWQRVRRYIRVAATEAMEVISEQELTDDLGPGFMGGQMAI